MQQDAQTISTRLTGKPDLRFAIYLSRGRGAWTVARSSEALPRRSANIAMSVHESVRDVLAETTRALQRWADEQRDVADMELDDGDGYWRLAVQPFAAHACPFELIVHDDGEHYDIAVDARSYQELRTRNLQLLPALARAIASGRVLTTRLHSARTGLLCAVETTISPEGDGLGTWRRLQYVTAVAELLNTDDCERQARHYLPYRRSLKP